MAVAVAVKSNLPYQPWLFPAMVAVVPFAEYDRRQAGKSLVQKLLKVRRSLDNTELEYLPELNTLIDKLRQVTKYSDHQREELVLYAIERSGATTVNEIAEDTKFTGDTVKEILHELHARNLVYQVRKYIPGSDRPNFAIKSRRVKVPEAD